MLWVHEPLQEDSILGSEFTRSGPVLQHGSQPATVDLQQETRDVKYRKCLGVWIRIVVPSIASVMALGTALWWDWIERIFGFDPDHHSGSIERELIISVFFAVMLFATLVPRMVHDHIARQSRERAQ